MLLTIGLMAVGMLMLAACPGTAVLGGWAQVIVIAGRLIQGLALGGEVGPSTAYLVEAAPPESRGFVASWQIASQGCAALFAGVFATGLTLVLGDAAMADWGWRVMFGLGLLVVPVGLVIRSHLPETAGADHDPNAAASTGAVVMRLLREHGRLLGLTFLVIAASTVSNAIGTNMPVYAGCDPRPLRDGRQRRADRARPRLGRLPPARRLARRPLRTATGADLAPRPDPAPRRAGILVAVARAGGARRLRRHLPALGAFLDQCGGDHRGDSRIAPRAVRSAGLSIVYAVSVSLFGGSTNYLVNWLIATTGDRMMPAYYLAAFSLVGTVAALLLPETRGRDLKRG